MSHVLLPAPAAQAADESWTTYGRYGVIAASELGGFNEPTNMAVGRDGHMYIADAGNNRIQKLDMAAGTWSEWRDAGSLGAFQPADVTADVYGNVYVADLMNHRVLKRSASDGEWSAWGKTGGGSGIGPGEFNRPTGLDVDAAGNVYVTDRENHRLQKWDASAETWSVWGGTARGSGPGQFNYLDDVAVDADGNVYVADTNNHRIQKLDAQSNTWSEWGRGGGASGDDPGEFYLPASVAVDSSGNVYVADAENHRIQKRDASSGEWIVWGRSGGGAGDGPGEFKKPGGISVDASGNVYVADTENDRVQKLAADTKVWTEWAAYGNSSGAALGQFNRPGGVATDGEGNVYVVEFTNQRVQKLTVDGMTWSSWGKSGGGAGNGAGEFSRPTGIAADDSGNLYVADTFNNRIQMMNAADAAWSQLGGGSGSGVGQFNRPSGAAIDGNGRLYIADTNNHRIQMRDAEGNWSLVGGGQGSALGQFSQPTGVAVDAWGNLYVADTGNHRVQRWSVSDDEWTAWGSGGVSGSGLGEFNSPTGVAVDRSGNVYAVDQANHRVQKWTKESGVWSQWGGGIPGSDPGQFNSPHSVAVDGLGNLYITDQGNHRLQKLSFGPKAPTLDAPTLDAPIPGDGQVALSWSKVEGATGYTLFLSDSADALGTEVATVTETVYTVTGLTNGTTYSFVVRGINGGAVGAASAPVSATPFTVPGAPRNVTATAGDGQATIHFDAPSTDGGREIVEYEVTSAPGGHTGTGAASPITVTGLTNGTSYTFTVAAKNAAGRGPSSSASNAVAPQSTSGSGGGSGGDTGESGGDTGGSGGPPSTSTGPQPNEAAGGASVWVNGKAESIGQATLSERGGRTVATVAIDPEALEQRLASEAPGAIVSIRGDSESNVFAGQLNGRMVERMASGQAILQIHTAEATYTLPAQQIGIESVARRFGAAVPLQEITVRIEIAEPTAERAEALEKAAAGRSYTFVAPPVEFTVRAEYKGRSIELESFEAYVERSIAIPEGVAPTRITTGVVFGAEGDARHVPTRVEEVDGRHRAVIRSLTNSEYTVIWNPMTFDDVSAHWSKEAVNDMGARLIVAGLEDGSFHPERNVTRAEFAEIVVRALGLPLASAADDAGAFADVQATDWYAAPIRIAHAYGLMNGFDDGTFRPNERLNREQAMTVIAAAMKVTGLSSEVGEYDADAALGVYADAETLSSWARNGAAESVLAGVIAGRSEDALAPKAELTRAEAASLVRKLLQRSGLI